MTKHLYRCIKAGWGIWIELDCVAHPLTDFVGEYVSVSDKLHFTTNTMKPTDVTDKWAKMRSSSFKQGLLIIADKVDTLIDKPIVLEVIDALYHLSDFQRESYGYAIANWVIKEYNLDIELPSLTYNKAKNRYIFPYEIDDVLST